MSEPLRLGIAGLGTVGVGVVRIVRQHAALLAARTGREISITAVSARSKDKDRGVPLADYAWEDDPVTLAKRDDVDVFVELMGGDAGPAKDATEAALAAGKHCLVRRHNMFTGRQSGFGCILCRTILTAHQFHEYIHVIACRQNRRVSFPSVVGQRHTSVFVVTAR